MPLVGAGGVGSVVGVGLYCHIFIFSTATEVEGGALTGSFGPHVALQEPPLATQDPSRKPPDHTPRSPSVMSCRQHSTGAVVSSQDVARDTEPEEVEGAARNSLPRPARARLWRGARRWSSGLRGMERACLPDSSALATRRPLRAWAPGRTHRSASGRPPTRTPDTPPHLSIAMPWAAAGAQGCVRIHCTPGSAAPLLLCCVSCCRGQD